MLWNVRVVPVTTLSSVIVMRLEPKKLLMASEKAAATEEWAETYSGEGRCGRERRPSWVRFGLRISIHGAGTDRRDRPPKGVMVLRIPGSYQGIRDGHIYHRKKPSGIGDVESLGNSKPPEGPGRLPGSALNVEAAKPKGRLGRGGKLDVNIDYVRTSSTV